MEVFREFGPPWPTAEAAERLKWLVYATLVDPAPAGCDFARIRQSPSGASYEVRFINESFPDRVPKVTTFLVRL